MDSKAKEVLTELKEAIESSAARVINDRQEWEKLVQSESPERAELLQELTSFSDLWKYFEEQQMALPRDIVEDIKGIAALPIPERTKAYREINRRLMERLPDDHRHSKSRV